MHEDLGCAFSAVKDYATRQWFVQQTLFGCGVQSRGIKCLSVRVLGVSHCAPRRCRFHAHQPTAAHPPPPCSPPTGPPPPALPPPAARPPAAGARPPAARPPPLAITISKRR